MSSAALLGVCTVRALDSELEVVVVEVGLLACIYPVVLCLSSSAITMCCINSSMLAVQVRSWGPQDLRKRIKVEFAGEDAYGSGVTRVGW